jgi:hypothetical protein
VAVNPRPTYGHWVRPRSPGVGPLGLLGSALLFGGLVAALIGFLIGGLLVGVGIAVGTASVIAVTIRPSGGRSAAEAASTRASWSIARRRREHLYRSGPLSRQETRHHRLPGVLASTAVMPAIDGFGNRFAVVVRRSSGLYTLVLRCRADGEALVDPATVDTWVAGWGVFLAALGHEPGLVAAALVVDTAPDPGTRLAAEVHGHADRAAPPLARQVMAEVVASYPADSSENTAYLAVTYSGPGISRRSRRPDAVIAEVTRRVPGLIAGIAASGAGTVEPLGEQELAEVARVAYDPGCATALARSRFHRSGSQLSWAQCGPVATQEAWDSYRHDSGVSATWSMTAPPAGAVPCEVLGPLLAPHPDFVRKRVALLYRPHAPAQVATIAERDVQTAAFTADGGRGRVTAAATQRIRATERSAAEVAEGAGVTRFALLVTVTVAREADLPQAATTVENLAATPRLRLRRCYGTQAAAFAATLPLGFVPWRHTTIPDSVRELL